MPGPIITRAGWGARYADGFGPASLPAAEIWLHHSVTAAPSPSATLEQDISAVRVLERIGQDRFGGGISYTFVVPPSGRIFQGHSVNRRGAHTSGHNTVGRAVCFVGNYEVLTPTTAQVDAVRWLLAHGHAARWWTQARLTGGHRDVSQTACPGQNAYARIRDMNVPWEEPDLTPEQDAMLRTIFAQITGDIDGRGPNGWGWPSFRHGGGPDLTPVDLLRHIDREVNSRFDLTGRPGADLDTLVGHVLSLRAELRELIERLSPPQA